MISGIRSTPSHWARTRCCTASKDEKVTRVAERIRSSSRRMAKMIEQLLDVARIRAGGVSLAMRPGNVAEVLSTIRDELEGGTGVRAHRGERSR